MSVDEMRSVVRLEAENKRLREALELTRRACGDVLHLQNNAFWLEPLGPRNFWVTMFVAAARDAQAGYDAANEALKPQ